MSDDVEITGLDELTRAFQNMGEKMARKAIHDALDASGSVLQVAQSEAAPEYEGSEKGSPHPAGQLKQDIRRKIKLNPEAGTGVVGIGPSKLSFYGAMREFGTSHESAHPWVRPAFDASAQEAIDVFGKVIAAYVQAATKGSA
jgi:HK97 gp10 family phage protein